MKVVWGCSKLQPSVTVAVRTRVQRSSSSSAFLFTGSGWETAALLAAGLIQRAGAFALKVCMRIGVVFFVCLLLRFLSLSLSFAFSMLPFFVVFILSLSLALSGLPSIFLFYFSLLSLSL